MKQHTSREFENELQVLKRRMIHMADRIQEMLENSINAFEKFDLELAKHTIKMDHQVNQDEMDIDEICLMLLAKRQPLGADLRFIIIAFKMVTDLERIGDLAVNICEREIKLHKLDAHISLPSITQMSHIVKEMIKEVIEAFISYDVGMAKSVIAKDDEVDEIYHSILRETLKMMVQKEDLIEPLIHVQSVAKWLERIGDHCTNLAEKVVFVVRGEDIRHAKKQEQM